MFALTPPRGRGTRHIEDESTLVARIEKILHAHQVETFFSVRYERQVERRMKQVGRGRGGPNRQYEVVERVRYQITSISWDEVAIEAARAVRLAGLRHECACGAPVVGRRRETVPPGMSD